MTILHHTFIFIILHLLSGCGVQDLRDKTTLRNAKVKAIEMSKLKKAFKYRMVWLYVDDNNDSFSGWVKKSHSNKKLSELGYLKNGQKEGLWLSWHKNGQKAGEIEWHNDRLSGTYNLWHENSNLHVSGQTMDGEMNGEWKEYYSSGLLQAHTLNQMGACVWKKIWLPTGEMCQQSVVNNGNGIYFEYKEDTQKPIKIKVLDGVVTEVSTTHPM